MDEIPKGVPYTRKHKLEDREDGLAHCLVCSGAEATLPRDCPGRRMTMSESLAVQSGRLQYVDGSWWSVNRRDQPAASLPHDPRFDTELDVMKGGGTDIFKGLTDTELEAFDPSAPDGERRRS